MNHLRMYLRVCLVVVAVALLSLTGCDEGHDKLVDGRVVINYWEKWTGFERDAMQAVVDDFNGSQDRVFVRMLSVSQMDRKLMLATAGGNPPDVAGLWSHTVNVYAEKGALEPLDRYIKEAGISRDDYIPVFWQLCEHRGFMWALPTTPATVALHWNKRMFREAGLDPDRPPRSLRELDAMAEQLTIVRLVRDGESVEVRYSQLTQTEKRDKTFTLVQVGHLPSEPGWFRQMWGYWFGGSLWDGERRITADSEANVQAMQWYAGYAQKYGVDNIRKFGASFGNFASPQNPFLSEQVAMVLQGVWMYNFIDQYAPHIEWAAAPFPSARGGDTNDFQAVSIAECDVLVIPKGSPHPREAFEFIRYVNTQSVMEKLNLGQRKFSPLSVMSDDFLVKHPNAYIGVFIELARSDHTRYVPRISVWNEYADELGVAMDQVYTLRVEPREALGRAQQRMQWKFDRVLRRWDMVKEHRLAEWRDDTN